MSKPFTTLAIACAGWLFTPCAAGQFAADSVITQIRIQSYSFSQFEWFLNEMRYQLQDDRYTCDSLVISRNYGYMTSEQRKADRKKNKRTGKFKRVKGLFLYKDNQTYAVSEVKTFNDSIPIAGFRAQLKDFHSSRSFSLRNFDLSKEEMELYLQRRFRSNDPAVVDSVRKMFTPALALPMDSLRRCEPICYVASHGQTRHGIRIYLRYRSGLEERLTFSDRDCDMLPPADFLALFPLLQRLPDDFYYNRRLFDKTMLCAITLGYVHTMVTKQKCWVWRRP